MVLNLGGKELQLRFGLHLGEMLIAEATGKQKIGTLQFMAMLIFYAHENYCLGYDMQPVMSKGAIFAYLEDNSADEALAKQLQVVLTAYNDSKTGQTFSEAAKGGTKKKTPAGVK